MTDQPDAVMLFAAGYGTRMGTLTKDRPKPLVEVAGKPLIDHTLELVDAIQPAKIVANLHYKSEMLATHLKPRDVKVSVEHPAILETGGGLKAALPLLGDGPVFAMNTDSIWAGPNPLELAQQAWDPARMDALLVCVPTSQAIGHAGNGDFDIDDAGRISRGKNLVYCGVQILQTNGLHDIHEPAFSLNVVWDQMLKRNRLFALTYPGQWCDVGHPKGITLAENMLAAQSV